jgi:hypothetical protein
MQATVEATRQYWWLFAVVGAVVAIGLVLWRMPSIRACFATIRCAKPAPPRRRVVEAESEYESDSDAGELSEERLLAHLKPAPPAEAVESAERDERAERAEAAEAETKARKAAEPEPKRRGRRRAEKPVTVTRECTE